MEDREATWRVRVQAWRKSGLSSLAFCEGKDFSSSSLLAWARRLRRGSDGPDDVRIARVLRGGEAPSGDVPLVLEVGAARVLVRRGFDAEALREVIEVLGASR